MIISKSRQTKRQAEQVLPATTLVLICNSIFLLLSMHLQAPADKTKRSEPNLEDFLQRRDFSGVAGKGSCCICRLHTGFAQGHAIAGAITWLHFKRHGAAKDPRMQEWLAYAHYHFAEHDKVCWLVARRRVFLLSSVCFVAACCAAAVASACTSEQCESLLSSSSCRSKPQETLHLCCSRSGT